MFNLCSPPKKIYLSWGKREREKERLCALSTPNKKQHDFSHLIHISCHLSIISHLFKKKHAGKNLRRPKKRPPWKTYGIRTSFARVPGFSSAPSNRCFRNEKIHAPNNGRMVRNFQVGSGRKRFPGSDPGALRCLPEFFHQLRGPRPEDGLLGWREV